MKKSVFTYEAFSTNRKTELEILLDLGRELNDTDYSNIRGCVDKLLEKLHEETVRLNPKTKEEYESTKARLLLLFGSRTIYVEEIPNGYCPCATCNQTSPWFIVTTAKGKIKIGWRKRVITIDWSDSLIKEDANVLFPNEDVTRWETGIHAWGYEKAKEYLDIILK